MALSSGYENKRARVEMLPLIDIVFLLLVFFIYAMLSMVVHRGIKVELPQASAAQVERKDYVGITITEDNTIFVDETAVTLESLVAQVGEAQRAKDNAPIFINGDRRADLGIAVRILDHLRRAGIAEVSFECAEERQ